MGNSNAPSTAAAAEAPAPEQTPTQPRKEGNKVIAGRYRLENKILGSGAFAVVKLGTDLHENKPVAIRIIDKEKLTPVSMQYLRRELEIYPKLSHSNIVHCYYCKEGKKYVVMVTEYMPDGTLSTHLTNRAAVREEEAREIFDQTLSAVEYLYAMNVAWRDLKCSNILLNLNKSLVKICDFGFADYADKPFTDFPGTMAYSPPEVVTATPYAASPREVWSFGVLLFKLLTGTYPFGTKTNVATKDRIVKEEPDFDSLVISDEGLELVKLMLAKDPAKRIGLFDIRTHPWMTKERLQSRRRAQSRAEIIPPSLGRTASSLAPPAIKIRERSPSAGNILLPLSPRVLVSSPRGLGNGLTSHVAVGSPPLSPLPQRSQPAMLAASPPQASLRPSPSPQRAQLVRSANSVLQETPSPRKGDDAHTKGAT